MKTYIVSTHLGDFEMMATSAKKALNNIRFRLFGRSGFAKTQYWTVIENETKESEVANG
jgi:hypothetical protein